MQRILRRVALSVFALWFVSVALFVMTHVISGSPADFVLGVDATAEQRQEFDRRLGLDRPVIEQYGAWLGGILRGDFGTSYVTGLALGDEIRRSFPITLEVVTLAFIIAVAFGVPLGMISALNPGRPVDHAARFIGVIGVSMPPFWTGMLLIVYLSVELHLLPPGGYTPLSSGVWAHFSAVALPALTLGIYSVAAISRLTRATMLEALSQDYIRTARAMGLSRIRIWSYAFTNALAPVVNVSAMTFGYSFGTALVVEQIFALPGLSRALFQAIFNRDFPMIQLTVLLITAVFIFCNLVADVLNTMLNPRLAKSA